MNVADYFNRLYGEHSRYWWIGKDRYSVDCDAYPYSLLTQMMLRTLLGRPPGRALDLGAGEGTDAIRLALMGYDVEALEISDVAVGKIARFAAEAGADVKVLKADLRSYDFSGEYDVIVCNGVLHYVEHEHKERILHRMQQATKADGINVVSLWSDYTPVPDCHDKVPAFCDSEDGIVTRQYKNWFTNLLYFERNKAEASHEELLPHHHSHIKLIATKPS